MIRTFKGRSPKIHRTAFIHDAAEVIGAAVVGERASVWPKAVIRADVGRIVLGARSNLQDNAVLHCREEHPCLVGKGVTIGHGAIVHGARVGDRCLIGMGSIVMEAVLGRECLVAAGAVVPPGARIPARSLVVGVPGKVARRLTPAEIRSLGASERSYTALAREHRATSRPAGRSR